MLKKLIFFSIVIGLFLTVLFLDQNSSPVPVKIILGDPRLIGLSTVIIISMITGAVLSLIGTFIFNSIRLRKPKLKS